MHLRAIRHVVCCEPGPVRIPAPASGSMAGGVFLQYLSLATTLHRSGILLPRMDPVLRATMPDGDPLMRRDLPLSDRAASDPAGPALLCARIHCETCWQWRCFGGDLRYRRFPTGVCFAPPNRLGGFIDNCGDGIIIWIIQPRSSLIGRILRQRWKLKWGGIAFEYLVCG